MKKRIGAVLLLTAVAVAAITAGFFGKSAAEEVNPRRINTVRLDDANVSYEASAWKDEGAKLGTATNPFVILELVPDKEALPGEIGYLISGCEPVEINRFETKERAEAFSEMNSPLFGFTNKFFVEEKNSFLEEWNISEENFQKVWSEQAEETVTLFGYYERVEAGQGDFIWQSQTMVQDEVTGLWIENFEKGTGEEASWIWHTMEDYEPEDTEKTARQKQRMRLEDDREYTENTDEIGSRIYSYRTAVGFYDGGDTYLYQHYEDFMRISLGLLDKKARDDFYVCIKTMTVKDLNALYANGTPEEKKDWIQAANLISVYGTNGALDYTGEKDLAWETVLAIVKRVAADNNPAAFFADSSLLKVENTPDGTRKADVTYHAFDWSGNYLGDSTRSGDGSSNNLFKLGIILTRWDARLFYSFFIQGEESGDLGGNWIDSEGNLIGEESRNGGCLSDAEKQYWGMGSFLPVDDLEKRDEIWEKYHVDTGADPVETNYIYKNVLFYDTTGEGKQGCLQGALTNRIENRDRFHKEFFAYLEQEKIPVQNQGSGGYISDSFLCLKYLLKDVLNATGGMQKTSLKILDLEPCNDFSTLTEFKIKTLFSDVNVSVEKIDIVRQTTAEFIGRIEDLSSTYDLIYLGMDDGALKKKDGHLVYGDTNLNDYIYLHVGDTVQQVDGRYSVNWISMEVLKNYWKNQNPDIDVASNNGKSYLRLPGNDITAKMKEELEAYVKAGYPIILSDDFKSMEAADSKKKVDKASNIYELVKKIQDKGNVYYEGDMEKLASLPEYLNKRKLEIDLMKAPAEYARDGHEGTYIQAETSGANKGNYYLSYVFHLKAGESGKTYTARLYLDANRDGRFSSGEVVASKKSIRAAEEATISAYASNEWFGAIPWKLEVTEDSGMQKAAVTGICAAKRTSDTPKETIEVLQVMQRPDNINNWANSTINLQSSDFEALMGNLEDYEINVTTVTITEFENIFRNGTGDGSRGYEGAKKAVRVVQGEEKTSETIGLDNFTMLVFGFSDDYANISNDQGALEWVKRYIASGRSVLFTHDNTSFFNSKDDGEKYRSNYNFTQYFRGIMGMDRFDIRYQLQGQETDEKQRVDSAGTTDTAYALNDRTKVYEEQQGYTYYAARRIAKDYEKAETVLNFSNLIQSSVNGTYTTTAVENVNNGQITRYPYYIEDNFTIASTHGQYYQLNMENEDIVVWYTLKNGGNQHGNTYDCSPRDTSNNYYIYNKGNITYTGIGHSNNPTEMERKLLVNTIIAAYKPAMMAPYFEFPDADFIEETAQGILCYDGYLNFDYGNYDYGSIGGESGELLPFTPMASGEGGDEVRVGIYQIYPTGSEDELCQVWDSDGNKLGEDKKMQITNKQGEKAWVWLLKNGETYFVECDKGAYQQENPPKLLFTIEKLENTMVVNRGKDTHVTLYRRELFELD